MTHGWQFIAILLAWWSMKTSRIIPVVAASAIALAGCAHCPVCGGEWGAARRAAEAAEAAARAPKIETIEVSVSCLERITVLPTYVLTVRLVDASTGKTVLDPENGQPLLLETRNGFESFPQTLSLSCDLRKTAPRTIYGLVAELESQGAVLFRTDTQYRVFGGNGGPIQLVLVRNR